MAYEYPTNLSKYGGGLVGYIKYINTQTEGLFILVWIIAFGVISFIYSQAKGTTTGRSYAIASFICLFFSIVSAIVGWLNYKITIMFAVLFGAGVAWLWLERKQQ